MRSPVELLVNAHNVKFSKRLACVAGVQAEGKGKKPAREVRDEGAREAHKGRAPFGPFPPFLLPATQATKRFDFQMFSVCILKR